MKAFLVFMGFATLAIIVQVEGRRSRWHRRHHPTTELCSQSPEPGRCRAYFERWHYDQSTGECKTFVYGGCGGNDNNFQTKDDCENRCIKGAGNTTQSSSSQCPPQVSCRLECPEGFLKNRRGCEICRCKSASFRRRSCSSKTCFNECAYGRALDRRGCPTCTCNIQPTCANINATCRLYCPTGFVKDANGCSTCKCVEDRPAAVSVATVCPNINKVGACRMYCQHGFARNADGCEICQCAVPTVGLLPASVSASGSSVDCSTRPACRKYCEHGFVKGDDGCDICRCKEVARIAIVSDCVRRDCKKYCAFGFQVDSNGCTTCTCKTSQDGGPSVEHHGLRGCADIRPTCAMQCETGFARDERGCEVCRCA